MLNRRTMLVSSAAALSGCAARRDHAGPNPDADAAFRAFVERLAGRQRTARPFLLRRFNAAQLTPAGRILYDAIMPGVEADAALAHLPFGDNGFPYAVTHRNGAYQRASEFRSGDEPRAAVRAVARETARLESDAARGIIPPDFVIDATLARIDAAAARAAASTNPAHAPIAEAIAIQRDVLAALRPRAGSEASVARLPGGPRFYALALQVNLGAVVDPHQAHAGAMARCHTLQAEADRLLRAAGLAQGDVAARLRALARDQRHLYPDSADGKAAAVADMNAALARARALATPAFAGVPLPEAEVRALPPAQEAGGAQGRRSGAIYFVDLGAIRTRPRWSLPSVVHHELIPGHILQAPMEAAADAPELQRRYAAGYSEGWSTYAEHAADALGAFHDDPLGRIGYLQWMLFRLARVVGDTGMHALGWSRERTIEEMRALQGESIAFVSIEEDVGRIAANPGAAAAQGLSAMHLIALSQQARGPAALSRFHGAMLRHGPLSPPGLEAALRASA